MDQLTTAATQIYYPESDGKPMGESDAHIDALIYLQERLRHHFPDDPQMYVAGIMLLYYEEGNPGACVAPDVFVVQGVAKHERRTYRLWDEGRPPTVVFEITSRGSRLENLGIKRMVYAMLGVQEYVLYDPLGEYLRPRLQGYQLQEGGYQRIPLADGGWTMPQPPLGPGKILTGVRFNEPMRVETLRDSGSNRWDVGLVGTPAEKSRRVSPSPHDFKALTILDSTATCDGDGVLLRLGRQAYALGIAYEFDPYFGLPVSRLEGLAAKTLNLEMLIERRDRCAETERSWKLQTGAGTGTSSDGGGMP